MYRRLKRELQAAGGLLRGTNVAVLNIAAILAVLLFGAFVLLDALIGVVPGPPPSADGVPAMQATATASGGGAAPAGRAATAPATGDGLLLPWRPLVALCFDETWDTAYTQAYPVLEHYGVSAGVVVVNCWVDTPDRLTWPQVVALSESGWEIVAGTMSCPDPLELAPDELEHEVRESHEALEGHVGRGKVRGLMWPQGKAAEREWVMAGRYFEWAAGGSEPVDGGLLLRHGLAAGAEYWSYRLPTVPATEGGMTCDGVAWSVQAALDRPVACLITLGRVEPTGAPEEAIDVAGLESLIQHLLSSGAVIVKPSELYRILRYGRPAYLDQGRELVRNASLRLAGAAAGVPSGFEVLAGQPVWHPAGGPAGAGYLEVSDRALFGTVDLPVAAGAGYRFSFTRRLGTSRSATALVVVDVLDTALNPVDTLRFEVPGATTQWTQAGVDLVVPAKGDSVRVHMASMDSGTLLTSGWSLVRR